MLLQVLVKLCKIKFHDLVQANRWTDMVKLKHEFLQIINCEQIRKGTHQ